MYSWVILVVSGASKWPSAAFVFTHIRSFTCVSSHVYFPYIRCGEGAPTVGEWTRERPFSWKKKEKAKQSLETDLSDLNGASSSLCSLVYFTAYEETWQGLQSNWYNTLWSPFLRWLFWDDSRIKGRQRYPADTRWQNVYAIHCIEIYQVDFKQLAPGGKDAWKMLESGGMNQSLFMRRKLNC